jgi:RNA polymerase sigma factor (TIGR02999 family)
MDAAGPEPFTQLLNRMVAGDSAAASQLAPVLYGELHALAERMMRDQGAAHTLQPTALIHEAWMKLVGASERNVESRAHFAALAGSAMRSVLVDHARRKFSEKRGGDAERVALDTELEDFEEPSVDLLELDEALTSLSAMDGELGRIVELRFFAGMSIDETAAVLGVSAPTIARRWRVARMWLWSELNAARS